MILIDTLVLFDIDLRVNLVFHGLLLMLLVLIARVRVVLFLFLVILVSRLLDDLGLRIIFFILSLDTFSLSLKVFFVHMIENFGALLRRLTMRLTLFGAQT